MKDDRRPSTDKGICPVCGMRNPEKCRELERLGIRSLVNGNPDVCPICGSDYSLLVWVKGFKMCGLCAENVDQALRIFRHKHRKRLDAIWIALDREDNG